MDANIAIARVLAKNMEPPKKGRAKRSLGNFYFNALLKKKNGTITATSNISRN
jgi:hypothetical protein